MRGTRRGPRGKLSGELRRIFLRDFSRRALPGNSFLLSNLSPHSGAPFSRPRSRPISHSRFPLTLRMSKRKLQRLSRFKPAPFPATAPRLPSRGIPRLPRGVPPFHPCQTPMPPAPFERCNLSPTAPNSCRRTCAQRVAAARIKSAEFVSVLAGLLIIFN